LILKERKSYNEKFIVCIFTKHCSANQIKENENAGYVTPMGE